MTRTLDRRTPVARPSETEMSLSGGYARPLRSRREAKLSLSVLTQRDGPRFRPIERSELQVLVVPPRARTAVCTLESQRGTRLARSWAIVKLGRPHYLLSGFALHALGTALAVISGATLHWQVWGLGALVIATAQSMTRYSNDYFDLAADIANRTLPAPLAIWHGVRLLRAAFRVPKRWDGLAWCSVTLLMATTFTELAGALLVLRAR